MAHTDLELGGHSAADIGDGDDEESICFSDAEEGSCYSQCYSTADGSYDDSGSNSRVSGSETRRASAAESDYSVEIGGGIMEIKVGLERVERDCRICKLSLESRYPNESGMIAIDLGCCCKNDLAAAHRNCAETWFKIKGNKTCEICNSIARNVYGVSEIESTHQTNESIMATNVFSAPVPPPSTETRSYLNGHRILNFLLACMVVAFLISWLFHFNIPS